MQARHEGTHLIIDLKSGNQGSSSSPIPSCYEERKAKSEKLPSLFAQGCCTRGYFSSRRLRSRSILSSGSRLLEISDDFCVVLIRLALKRRGLYGSQAAGRLLKKKMASPWRQHLPQAPANTSWQENGEQLGHAPILAFLKEEREGAVCAKCKGRAGKLRKIDDKSLHCLPTHPQRQPTLSSLSVL